MRATSTNCRRFRRRRTSRRGGGSRDTGRAARQADLPFPGLYSGPRRHFSWLGRHQPPFRKYRMWCKPLAKCESGRYRQKYRHLSCLPADASGLWRIDMPTIRYGTGVHLARSAAARPTRYRHPEANSPLRNLIGPRPARKSSFQAASFRRPITNLRLPNPIKGAAPRRKASSLGQQESALGEREGEQFELGRGSLCQGLRRTQGVHPDRCGPVHFAGMRFVEFRLVHANARVSNGPQGLFGWPFNSVNWTNAAALNGAIANVGPVKIGVASANLASGPQGQVTPGTIGWAIYGLPTGRPENHCASLCGYGPLAALVDLFERHGSMSICRRACPRDFATRCLLGAPSASSTGNR